MSYFVAFSVSLASTFLAAFAGSVASIEAGAFYAALTKPPWAPPGSVFGPVWTLLYAMMAVAGGMALGAKSRNTRGLLLLFMLQLALNALWSWTFFKWESGSGSMATIVTLVLAILATTVAFWRTNRVSGALMLPYLFWVLFATVLNAEVWRLNPASL